jgi:hypothetical protein
MNHNNTTNINSKAWFLFSIFFGFHRVIITALLNDDIKLIFLHILIGAPMRRLLSWEHHSNPYHERGGVGVVSRSGFVTGSGFVTRSRFVTGS